MNKPAIVRFLATELFEWKIVVSGIMPTEYYWDGKKEVVAVASFNPFNDVAHAFMIEDAIAKMEGTKISENFTRSKESDYVAQLEKDLSISVTDYDNEVTNYDALFALAHASPRQRTIAAARALATDEQLREMGL